ncbi:ABC transporter permease [Amycolatopsis saalfeldensis]|uniref:Peptide/nickel transport system permease protein n=1 Tax=Amycolatopsis saalfeldensis TaxID=394193 RepID=A0A1H8XYD4_9PSEU|nr:ABC transporter permease [Amycolatopsis saalfeldensis]SEP44762.1 peptide/nickel transport system permease protein [Amycolatopsis saalfeldensis]
MATLTGRRLRRSLPSGAPARFVLRRLGLLVITLILLSLLVFFAGQLLPGNPARAILGPLAPQSAVDELSRQLGTDRSLVVQYGQWIAHAVGGNLGLSYTFHQPVASFLGPALGRSALLALVAFAICVPVAVLAGVLAGLHAGKAIDRIIGVVGFSALALPEFVSGVLLILVLGVWAHAFPVQAVPPAGSGFAIQLYYLILPAVPLVIVLFGYLMRMVRAGVIETLAADCTRTAELKGLPRRRVIFRHVLRNALPPTITVLASQAGYVLGGLVVIEQLFHYPGIGSLIFTATQAKDFPMLEGGVLCLGVTFMIITLAADLLTAFLRPGSIEVSRT